MKKEKKWFLCKKETIYINNSRPTYEIICIEKKYNVLHNQQKIIEFGAKFLHIVIYNLIIIIIHHRNLILLNNYVRYIVCDLHLTLRCHNNVQLEIALLSKFYNKLLYGLNLHTTYFYYFFYTKLDLNEYFYKFD